MALGLTKILWIYPINQNRLLSLRNVRSKPLESHITDTKIRLQSRQNDVMIDGIKRSAQGKKQQNFASVSIDLIDQLFFTIYIYIVNNNWSLKSIETEAKFCCFLTSSLYTYMYIYIMSHHSFTYCNIFACSFILLWWVLFIVKHELL